MQIEVLGSSSAGNAYVVSDGETNILLECGFTLKEMQSRSLFNLVNVDACFISHYHQDHSKGVNDLLKYAIDVYALPETLSALNVSEHHRAKAVEVGKVIDINTLKILPVSMYHDCPCVGYMVYSTKTNERLFFATDTYKITVNPQEVDYLILEINYQKEIVNNLVNEGIMEASVRARLLFSHFELSKAISWLNKIDKSRLKRIYVCHLSSRNSNESEIKNTLIENFGIPVTICQS